MPTPLLQATHVSLRFGGLKALRNICLAVHSGEIIGIVGPNGAGKSSLFNTLSGLYPPTGGHISFKGKPLRRQITRKIFLLCCLGILSFAASVTLLAANPDRMFAVAVKEGFAQQGELSNSHYMRWVEYLRDQPQAEKQMLGARVVSADGHTHFGNYPTLHAGHQAALALKKKASIQRQAERAGGRLRLHFLLGVMVGTAVCVSLFWQMRISPAFVAEAGMSRTFQNNRLFASLSVFENVQVAKERLGSDSTPFVLVALGAAALLFALFNALEFFPQSFLTWLVASIIFAIAARLTFHTWVRASARNREKQALMQTEMFGLLDTVGLRRRAKIRAAHLSYGERRILEIARAWATNPALLLLDEPAAGMNAQETGVLLALLREIRKMGTAILLIEHDMPLVMSVCDRVVVLDRGQIIAEGLPGEIQKNQQVIDAYLGSSQSLKET